MKYILLTFSLLLFNGCNKNPEKEVFFKIDLSKSVPSLNYTEFVDSVSYITFSTGTDCLLSTINKIYFDNDTVIIKSKLSEGVFVFTRNGEFITQINPVGAGPEEYIEPTIIAVDKNNHNISIFDAASQKIMKFNYRGEYLGDIRIEKDYCYPHDMAINKDGNFIMMNAANYNKKQHSGVWLSDKNYKYIKHILNDVPSGYAFENITTYYNYSVHGIYYYDMNKDFIYLIQNDSAKILYQIDLKQNFPPAMRKKGEPHPDELTGLANICYFGITENYILLDYFVFGEDIPYRWVLIDRKNNSISPAYNQLNNDIDDKIDFNPRFFHIDDYTVCRVMEGKETDCDITIQLLHLK